MCFQRELTLHFLSQLPLLEVGQLWLLHHHYRTWTERWNFFTTLVGHKEAFIHLLLIFERLGVQNTGDWPFSSFWVSALKETFCVENSPPEPWASGCFLNEADMAFRFLTYLRTGSPTCVFTGCYVQVLLLIHNAHVQNLEFRGKLAEVWVMTNWEDAEKQASATMSSCKFLAS